jgi:hypothetical protein
MHVQGGKAIGLSVVIVGTKAAQSGDLGTKEARKYNEFGQKLASYSQALQRVTSISTIFTRTYYVGLLCA